MFKSTRNLKTLYAFLFSKDMKKFLPCQILPQRINERPCFARDVTTETTDSRSKLLNRQGWPNRVRRGCIRYRSPAIPKSTKKSQPRIAQNPLITQTKLGENYLYYKRCCCGFSFLTSTLNYNIACKRGNSLTQISFTSIQIWHRTFNRGRKS